MRKFLLPVGVGVAVAAVAVAAGWAFFGDRGGEPLAGPTTDPSVSANPTISASQAPVDPQPSPPVDGAIPVPAFPNSSIPWLEVGPGWFLLSYDPDTTDDVWPAEEDGPSSDLDEALMLVSPAGDLYYVRTLADVGPGRILMWAGDGVTILDTHYSVDDPYSDPASGQAFSVNLSTGATTPMSDDAKWGWYPRVLPDGRVALTQAAEDGWGWLEVRGADMGFLLSTCETVSLDFTGLSPDGQYVVCLENGADGADVMLQDIEGGAATRIDTFEYPVDSYNLYGWWDASSFVLSRVDDTSGATLRWAYDVTTRKIRDLNATLSDGTPADDVQGVAGYRLLYRDEIIEVQDFEGALRATMPCSPSAFSGHVALAVCGQPGARTDIFVADLDSGQVVTVTSFDPGPASALEVFPAPGGEKTYWGQ